MTGYVVDSMPIAAAFALITALILLACEAGFLVGRRYQRIAGDPDASSSIGAMVGGLLGMLAFVLAFTFSMAANQHDDRKQDVLEEANIIGAAYLRADLLGPERALPVRELLRDYVRTRLDATRPGADLQAAVDRSVEIHGRLWEHASNAALESRGGLATLMVRSVNELIDMHGKRYADAVRARIPESIWQGLAAIVVLSMGTLGLQVGLSGKRRLVALVPVALAFAVLATLMIDLNRPQGGSITISQDAMRDLLRQMESTR